MIDLIYSTMPVTMSTSPVTSNQLCVDRLPKRVAASVNVPAMIIIIPFMSLSVLIGSAKVRISE